MITPHTGTYRTYIIVLEDKNHVHDLVKEEQTWFMTASTRIKMK